jgi:biopolymer transport protein ExbB
MPLPSSNPYGLAHLWAQGDAVTRFVALALLCMSVLSWVVIVLGAIRLWGIHQAAHAASRFWHRQTLREGHQVLQVPGCPHNPFLKVLEEGEACVTHHASNREELHGQLNLSDWLTESLQETIDESRQRTQAGFTMLASIGATAPFVGLFGTVWGIYHALVSLGQGGTGGPLGIDRVAGPVGEALIMTALGLAVAIPATLAYNALLRKHKMLMSQVGRFAHQLHAYFLTGSPVHRAPDSHSQA